MKEFGGQTSTGRLRRVLVCSPQRAGWDRPGVRATARALGFDHEPDPVAATSDHHQLLSALTEAAVQVEKLAEGQGLDSVYVHDASWMLDDGALLLRPGKEARRAEVDSHADFYATAGIPVVGSLAGSATAEGGDLIWLDPRTVMAGHSYRTNREGLQQLASLFQRHDIRLRVAPLPHGNGPKECLHLMSLISPLDQTTFLVDLEWLAVSTVQELESRRLRLIPIESRERATLAGNVLPLGDGRLIMFQGNPRTAERLDQAGFTVQEIPGDEIGVLGTGGPTCLTRPLWREA